MNDRNVPEPVSAFPHHCPDLTSCCLQLLPRCAKGLQIYILYSLRIYLIWKTEQIILQMSKLRSSLKSRSLLLQKPFLHIDLQPFSHPAEPPDRILA